MRVGVFNQKVFFVDLSRVLAMVFSNTFFYRLEGFGEERFDVDPFLIEPDF